MPNTQTKPTMKLICQSSASNLGGDDIIRCPETGKWLRVWEKDMTCAGGWLTVTGFYLGEPDWVVLALRKNTRFNVYTTA